MTSGYERARQAARTLCRAARVIQELNERTLSQSEALVDTSRALIDAARRPRAGANIAATLPWRGRMSS